MGELFFLIAITEMCARIQWEQAAYLFEPAEHSLGTTELGEFPHTLFL